MFLRPLFFYNTKLFLCTIKFTVHNFYVSLLYWFTFCHIIGIFSLPGITLTLYRTGDASYARSWKYCSCAVDACIKQDGGQDRDTTHEENETELKVTGVTPESVIRALVLRVSLDFAVN